MGVPRLFPWLTNTFKDIVWVIKRGQYFIDVDNLYIDSQGILHAACQLIFNYGQKKRLFDAFASLSFPEKQTKVFNLYFETIKTIVKMVRPKKTLFISNDGPAPLAKQSQQRQRRSLAAMSRTGDEFDSNALTPGTVFMFEHAKYMHFAIRKEIQNNEEWKKFQVIFSSCGEAGEGEHKLISYIRALPESQREAESHCIVGPDGDLIMLALSAHVPKIYLLREDMDTIDIYYLVDMGKVRSGLQTVFPPVAGAKRWYDDTVNDFIILGFLVGNDFLPKIQMFMYLEDGLELMIKIYKEIYNEMKQYLTVDGEINFEVLTAFIKKLSESEKTYLEAQAPYSFEIMRATNPSLRREGEVIDRRYDPIFIDRTLLANIDANMKLNTESYRVDYYAKSGIYVETAGGQAAVETMCQDYLKTLVWIGKYYISGLPSWDHYYSWHYPPLMADLYRVLAKTVSFDSLTTFEKDEPSLPFVQLLCVLPPKSAHLLPTPFQRLLLDEDSPLVKAGTYPETFEIDYEGKTKKHFGIALLSFADITLVRKCYSHMMGLIEKKVGAEKAKKIFQRNRPSKSKVFWYDRAFKATYQSDYGSVKMSVRDKYLD